MNETLFLPSISNRSEMALFDQTELESYTISKDLLATTENDRIDQQAAFIASVATSSTTSDQPPLIIVQVVPSRRGLGCLPFLAGVVVMLVVVALFARP